MKTIDKFVCVMLLAMFGLDMAIAITAGHSSGTQVVPQPPPGIPVETDIFKRNPQCALIDGPRKGGESLQQLNWAMVPCLAALTPFLAPSKSFFNPSDAVSLWLDYGIKFAYKRAEIVVWFDDCDNGNYDKVMALATDINKALEKRDGKMWGWPVELRTIMRRCTRRPQMHGKF